MKSLLLVLFLFNTILLHSQIDKSDGDDYVEDVLKLEYNLDAQRVMLKGYSPISYFDNSPEMGDPQFQVQHGEVVYYFTSNDQKSLFEQNPEKYVPAFGGYCAYGVAKGKHLDIDPKNYKMINGKVHLFLRNDEADALALWNKGKEDSMLEDAAANWEILKLLPDTH